MDISIRSLEVTDAERLARYANNRKIWNQVRDLFPHPYTEDDARTFISNATTSDVNHIFAICDPSGLVGVTGIHPFSDVYRYKAEVGYWIGEPFWGKGYATTALSLLISFAWEHTDLQRLEAGVFSFNIASRRVAEKAGFHLESIKKKSVFKNDQFYDEYAYVALRPD